MTFGNHVTTGAPEPGRVEVRRAKTRELILAAAWDVAGRQGLEALSLREIGAAVGMQAPSLYSYFPSKAAILDALFADGYHQLDAQLRGVGDALPPEATPRERLVGLLAVWMSFCQADRARYQLLFTVAVPGWVPSADAYAVSLASFERARDHLTLAGITRTEDVDLCTALSAGLVAQQMANDPDGDRWVRRIDEVVDMFLLYTTERDASAESTRRGTP